MRKKSRKSDSSGITMKALAKEAGVSTATIMRSRSGKKIGFGSAALIAKALERLKGKNATTDSGNGHGLTHAAAIKPAEPFTASITRRPDGVCAVVVFTDEEKLGSLIGRLLGHGSDA